MVRHKAEEGRVAVRNLRRAGRHELEALQKDGELSTDELERVEKEIEKITHEQVAADRPAARAQRARAAPGLRSGRAHGTDDTDDHDTRLRHRPRPASATRRHGRPIDEDPPSYHSGRVRIIGAEPAGDTVREVTGPVVDEHPDLPHWNDAPTGQVPAVLDRSTARSRRSPRRPGARRTNDWEAQEEIFEPSMLSDDLPAVGALLDDNDESRRRTPALALRVRRHPRHRPRARPGARARGAEPREPDAGRREPDPIARTSPLRPPGPSRARSVAAVARR